MSPVVFIDVTFTHMKYPWILQSMIWSHRNYSAPHDAEESYNQMCWGNGLDVGSDASSGGDERNYMIKVDRNGMVERSGTDHNESDVACKERKFDHSGRDALGTGSDVRCSVRGVDGKKRIIDPGDCGVTSDVSHSILLLGTLPWIRSLNTFIQEGNWTSHMQQSWRRLIVIVLVIRALTLSSMRRYSFNSPSHFIEKIEDWRI